MTPANYTYAIARAFDPARLIGLRGIDGAAVRLVRHRNLVAVVSPLAPAAAEEAALKTRLETLAELETIARSHHAVVEAVAASSVTLPLRLATIHKDDDRVAEVLRRGYRDLYAALDRLSGRVELGVKVHLDRSAGVGWSETQIAAGSRNPGRDYLHHRRQQRDQRELAAERAAVAARHVDVVLTGLVVARREHRPQRALAATAASQNVLNVAYLVEAERVDEFFERCRRLGRENAGISVEVTGPWAPYSFAMSTDRTGPTPSDHGERT